MELSAAISSVMKSLRNIFELFYDWMSINYLLILKQKDLVLLMGELNCYTCIDIYILSYLVRCLPSIHAARMVPGYLS